MERIGRGLRSPRFPGPTVKVRPPGAVFRAGAHPEWIMTRGELYRAVWGRALEAGDRLVDVYVSRLRAKLGRALPGKSFIHTRFGIGYRFSPGR